MKLIIMNLISMNLIQRESDSEYKKVLKEVKIGMNQE